MKKRALAICIHANDKLLIYLQMKNGQNSCRKYMTAAYNKKCQKYLINCIKNFPMQSMKVEDLSDVKRLF